MAVANPREVPEYELNPLELQIRKGDGISKAWFSFVFKFSFWLFVIYYKIRTSLLHYAAKVGD